MTAAEVKAYLRTAAMKARKTGQTQKVGNTGWTIRLVDEPHPGYCHAEGTWQVHDAFGELRVGLVNTPRSIQRLLMYAGLEILADDDPHVQRRPQAERRRRAARHWTEVAQR